MPIISHRFSLSSFSQQFYALILFLAFESSDSGDAKRLPRRRHLSTRRSSSSSSLKKEERSAMRLIFTSGKFGHGHESPVTDTCAASARYWFSSRWENSLQLPAEQPVCILHEAVTSRVHLLLQSNWRVTSGNYAPEFWAHRARLPSSLPVVAFTLAAFWLNGVSVQAAAASSRSVTSENVSSALLRLLRKVPPQLPCNDNLRSKRNSEQSNVAIYTLCFEVNTSSCFSLQSLLVS